MGAALSSHGFSDPQHRQLLAEYLGHAQKNLDECAQIFRGASSRYSGGDDDDDDDSEYVERTSGKTVRRLSHHGSASAAAGAPPPVGYPRHLDYSRFEEVFGMLVADAEPHFEFFLDEAAQTACAHQVFCAMALLMRADLHAKVTFLLRLYADSIGQLSTERTRMAVQDFLIALQLALNLAEEVSGDVLSVLEKAFGAEGESKVMSVRDVYDICFTNARVSGYLHDIQTLVQAFIADYEREIQRSQSTHALLASPKSAADAAPSAGGADKVKVLSRTASAFALPQDSLLWSLRARDYAHYWRQPRVEQQSSATCAHALRAMADADVHAVLVFDAPAGASSHATASDVRVYSGLVSTGAFLQFFRHFLPPEPTSFHIERAIRKLGAATLRDVLRFCANPLERFQCIDETEPFFSVLLRLARGSECVAVVADTPEHAHSFVLGRLSALDALAWLEEDLTLLNGKAAHALHAFPPFFYTPTSVLANKTSVCDGFAAMCDHKRAAIAVAFKDGASAHKLLCREAFRDFFVQSYGVWANVISNDDGRASPLLCALSDVVPALADPVCVSPESSVASAIRAMVDANATRALICALQDDTSAPVATTGAAVGVVRATDILFLLLHEQQQQRR